MSREGQIVGAECDGPDHVVIRVYVPEYLRTARLWAAAMDEPLAEVLAGDIESVDVLGLVPLRDDVCYAEVCIVDALNSGLRGYDFEGFVHGAKNTVEAMGQARAAMAEWQDERTEPPELEAGVAAAYRGEFHEARALLARVGSFWTEQTRGT